MHNIACCYQKLKDYENCIIYLDSVIYHFEKDLEKRYQIKITEDFFLENMNKDLSNNNVLGDMTLELRICAKFHLQMCAVLSQANKHLKALKHAKLSLLICEDNLIKTYYLFIQMKNKNINILESDEDKKEKKDSDSSENNDSKNEVKLKLIKKIIFDLYNKIKYLKNNNINNETNEKNNKKENNSFDSYLKYRKNEIHNYQKNLALLNNIRKLYNNEENNKEDWLSNLNIGNIMYLSPLNDGDLDFEGEPKYELLKDAIIEKVIFLSVSYFCISMELNQLSKDKYNKKINGEFFLNQACNLSDMYLPVSCPITKHYINSYYKYYEKDLDIIPEGKKIDYKINLSRNEIDINKDTQSFVRMQQIKYINNSSDTINKLNFSKINKKKELSDINSSIATNHNNRTKRSKISFGLKINLENIVNNKNNSSRENAPKNIKLNSIKNNSNIKKMNNNEIKTNNNLEIFPNKNNLNIAEKSKLKDFPKFKLNFNKINNLNKSGEDNKNSSNNTNNTAKNRIKKINVKLSVHNKTNRDSSSKNKSKIDKFKIKKGIKMERLNINKRPIDIKDALGTNRKVKPNNKNKNNIKNNNNTKHISKTSRQQKSPLANNKAITKVNIFEKLTINKIKHSKKSDDKKTKNSGNKKNVGYLTQRENTYKLKERINLNSDIQLKSKNNSLNNKNIKHIKQLNSFNGGHKYINNLNKNKLNTNNNNNNNTLQTSKIEQSKKINKDSSKKNNLKHSQISSIDKVFKNLFYIEIKSNNTNNINNKNTETVLQCGKLFVNSEHVNNFAPLIKNPFKI